MENHLKMLRTFAEEQVEQYVADVVNKGNTDAKVLLLVNGKMIMVKVEQTLKVRHLTIDVASSCSMFIFGLFSYVYKL